MKSSKDLQNANWWANLEEEDPITLEPLSTLPYPPFELPTEERPNIVDKRRFLFDAHVFAEYIISQVL